MEIRIIKMTREELHERVWTEPMTKVAAGIGLSDVGLKKICTKHRVPVPGRGFWQRLKAGERVHRIALPVIKNAPEIVFRIAPEKPEMGDRDMELDSMKAAEMAAGDVVVPAVLDRPHAITRAMRQELKGQKPDEYGAIRCTSPGLPFVRIHPASADRTLRIADALIRACEARKFELLPGTQGSRAGGQLRIGVDGETFELSIDERMRRVTHKPTPDELARRKRGLFVYTPAYDYEPSGELTLKIGFSYSSGLQSSWADTRNRKIDERLGEVMLALRQHAAWRKADREKARRREERFQAAQQKRAELRARVEAERRAIAQLEKDADDWRRAEAIRAYVAAAQGRNAAGQQSQEKMQWAAWALAQADRIDPLCDSPPSVLDTPEADMQPLLLWQFTRDEQLEDADEQALNVSR